MRLDFIDGDFVLLRPPPIAYASIVRQYHLALLGQLEGFNIYPFDCVVEEQIYQTLRLYYQKVANQLPIYGNHEPTENLKKIKVWILSCLQTAIG